MEAEDLLLYHTLLQYLLGSSLPYESPVFVDPPHPVKGNGMDLTLGIGHLKKKVVFRNKIYLTEGYIDNILLNLS